MDKTNMSNVTQPVASAQKTDAFFNDSIYNAEAAAFSHQQLTDHMAYAEGMEVLDSTLLEQVSAARDRYNYNKYTAADVMRALAKEQRGVEDFAALLSPAALPLLEDIAR